MPDLPSISIVIPTLNSAKTLGDCLESIVQQDYPRDKLEVVIADGGSIDSTLDIAKSKLQAMRFVPLSNPLKTGEAGKAVGVRQARNEIIALIDSDNILPQTDWLRQMVEPFCDDEIIAAEPLYYTYRKTDPYITRYCAILGMNDPVCLWLGNYDRYCILTGKWTGVPHSSEDKGNYLKIEFSNPNDLPTIGANGFLIRRKIIQQYLIGDYLFDIDIIYTLVYNSKCRIAKLKIGIIHLYCSKVSQFVKKQTRRVQDYICYNRLGLRKYPWKSIKKLKIIKFCTSTVFLIFPFLQVLKGILKYRDIAWFFHPIACCLTLCIYGYNILRGKWLSISIKSRADWGQQGECKFKHHRSD